MLANVDGHPKGMYINVDMSVVSHLPVMKVDR